MSTHMMKLCLHCDVYMYDGICVCSVISTCIMNLCLHCSVMPTCMMKLCLQCDFYMYDIPSERWTLITDDTHSMGGPALIFDHQMAIDTDQQTIYIFGGRVLSRSVLFLFILFYV